MVALVALAGESKANGSRTELARPGHGHFLDRSAQEFRTAQGPGIRNDRQGGARSEHTPTVRRSPTLHASSQIPPPDMLSALAASPAVPRDSCPSSDQLGACILWLASLLVASRDSCVRVGHRSLALMCTPLKRGSTALQSPSRRARPTAVVSRLTFLLWIVLSNGGRPGSAFSDSGTR